MGLNIELFSAVINKNLFMNNTFMRMGTDHSQYVRYLTGDGSVKGAAVVHVPSAGLRPNVVKNRSSFPATATGRTDIDLTYNLDEYSTDPWYMTQTEAETVAYDKASDLVYGMTNTLAETLGNNTAYAWAPVSASTFGVSRIVYTDGASDTNALSPGATGARSAITLSNFAQAKTILDNDRMPADGERYFVIPSAMWNLQVLQLANITQFLQLGSTSGLQEGTISPQTIPGFCGRIYGMNVIERPSVVVYDSGTTLSTIGDNGVPTSTTTADNFGAIFFHKTAVSNAIGNTVLFYNPDRAEYYGSLFSAYVRHGAAQLRSTIDGCGVGAVVQKA